MAWLNDDTRRLRRVATTSGTRLRLRLRAVARVVGKKEPLGFLARSRALDGGEGSFPLGTD